MKIGIDTRLWNQTGVGRYIRNLTLNLQKIDKDNDYILFVRNSDYDDVKFQISRPKADQPMAENFKIVQTDISWHSIEEQIKFHQILNKENLDLVHFPYYSVPVFYNKPFVVTLHDLIPLHFQTGYASTLPFPFYKFKFFAYRFIVYQATKKAKKIIVPSIATKADVVKYLKIPSSKIEVIYEAVDDVLRSNKISKKENMIMYVGNVYPHKNLETVLSAIKSSNRQVKLILVGKEDYFYKRLKRKVEDMQLERQVAFYGFARDEELSSLYKRAKALVIPSFIEGFGLPALEAMANKCLVLASDIPVHREIYKDAAIYFNPKDVTDLAKKIKHVCFNDSNHFKNYIDKGFKRAKEFSWQKTAEETLSLYESCASTGLA